MPRKEFDAFTRLDASDVNSFLMDQSVMTFGSATARDAAIDTPAEGQVTYLTDIDSLTVYNGTQWVTNRPIMNFAGTAARGSAITSPVEGMVTYLEDTDRLEFYNGSAWANPYDLALVKSQVIGTAVSSVTVTDAFSAKYDAYRIIVNGGAASANGLLNLQLAGVASGYYYSLSGARYDNANYVGANVNDGSSFVGAGNHYTNEITMNVDLLNPFLTTKTWLSANQVSFSSFNSYGYGAGEVSGGSRTGFVISPASGTMTGGTIRVYGYRNA